MNSNVKSDSDLIATNRSVAKAVLAIHVIIAELANKKLVSFYTPDRFSFGEPISGIRIGYASLSKENLKKGVEILSKYL